MLGFLIRPKTVFYFRKDVMVKFGAKGNFCWAEGNSTFEKWKHHQENGRTCTLI
jgi:hypothetical protein